MTVEEAGAFLGALFAVLAAAGVGLIGALVTVWAAWANRVRPMLEGTRTAAQSAAKELRNNSGSSTRDVLDRIEQVARETRSELHQTRSEITAVRADVSGLSQRAHNTHAEIYQRIRALESASEDRQ